MSEKAEILVRENAKAAAAPVARPLSGSDKGNTYLVEVNLKPEFGDAEGGAAKWLLHNAGVSAVRDVRVGRLYEVKGQINLGHIHTAVRELLCDCVTQEFRVYHSSSASENGMNRWRVEVWLKPTVTDTVGESVNSALLELGIPGPMAVRCGLAYHITGKCGRNQLEKAAARSLANPIIHRYSVNEEHQ